MATGDDSPGLVTRVDRVWMLAPFKKALESRQREITLVTALGECIDRLRANPTSPGLHLETLHGPAGRPILSARINRSFRLILTPLSAREIGLLHFDNHDEAYRWVDRNAQRIPTMLTRIDEVMSGRPIIRSLDVLPAVRRDENEPIPVISGAQLSRMVDEGLERYLAYLDDDQRRIAEIRASGLLLVKGGAGTGKTAVAIHRALWLARQPRLEGLGPAGILYVCFNQALASAVDQIVGSLTFGQRPGNLEVRTIHSWCWSLLNASDPQLKMDEGNEVRNQTYRAYGRLTRDQKAVLAPQIGTFVYDEIEQVIKTNGLETREEYLAFNRRGRGTGLKQPAREAIWDVYEQVRSWQIEHGKLTWNDVPSLALKQLQKAAEAPRYGGVVIDEGQDCTPVMVRLARALVGPNGQLTILADPAQEIYECGFQWTQRELRPHGGNTRWLRKTYRTTREIYDLARPLLSDVADLADDLTHLDPPERHGPRPEAIACTDASEVTHELATRIAASVDERPANQVGLVASTRQELMAMASELSVRGIAYQLCDRDAGSIRLAERSVKLLTMHAVKGLDFPVVFVVAPTSSTPGWEATRLAECCRRLYVALTRSSDRLTIGLVYGKQHVLVDRLDPAHLEASGTRGREFANMAGVTIGSASVR